MKKAVWAVITIAALALIFGCAKVTDVTVSPAETVAVKGETLQLSASVEGTGNPRQKVNWEIVEPVSEGTAVDAEGLLTVAAGEEAFTLTVRAVSAADKSKSATASLTLVPSRESIYGDWRGTRRIVLTDDTLTGYIEYSSFKLEDLSWLPAVNEDTATRDEYPSGYIISGTLTEVYRVGNLNRGQQHSDKLYLHRDGTKMILQQRASHVLNRVE